MLSVAILFTAWKMGVIKTFRPSFIYTVAERFHHIIFHFDTVYTL